MKISGAKTVLRRRKFFNSCPTQALCLMLVSGIVIAHFHVVTLPPSYWLLIMLAASAFAILMKNELHKSLLILAAFLMAGALLTSLQEEQNRQPAATRSYSHLSALDRTRLKALSLRSELTERIGNQHLASQQQAIITAMTLGEKGSLSKDTRQTFKASGASHILAISGLHIGIIFQLFILLAGGRKRWRLIAVPISVTAIWAYVFLIALPASAVRAASMISIYCFALLTRRNSTAVSNLTLAAIVMLIIQPLHLFDISFQLSFAAVLSILLLYKPIYSLLPALGHPPQALGLGMGNGGGIGGCPGGNHTAGVLLFRQHRLLFRTQLVCRHSRCHGHHLCQSVAAALVLPPAGILPAAGRTGIPAEPHHLRHPACPAADSHAAGSLHRGDKNKHPAIRPHLYCHHCRMLAYSKTSSMPSSPNSSSV